MIDSLKQQKMKVRIDNWEKNRNNSIKYSIENSNELFHLIKKLNGKNHTQLILESSNGFLIIGGGNDLFVISNVIGDNEKSFTLVNGDNENEVEVVTGGQSGLFPKKMVVNFEIAIKIAKTYFATSKMDSQFIWEED